MDKSAYDNKLVIKVVTDNGFVAPPAVEFFKPDARGPEYGQWKAEVRQDTGNIRVSKIHEPDEMGRRNNNDFSMEFSHPGDFERWAKDCT